MSDIRVRQRNDMLWLILGQQPQNDLTIRTLNQLTIALLKAIEKRPRLIVITGTGEEAFCSGIALSDATDELHQALLHAARDISDVLARVRNAGITTVALVKGLACGAGSELVALCDVTFARDDACFRLPNTSSVLFPASLSETLPAAIGIEATLRYSQSGETLTALEALQLGLVHQVIAGPRFVQDVEELLTMLASTTPSVH